MKKKRNIKNLVLFLLFLIPLFSCTNTNIDTKQKEIAFNSDSTKSYFIPDIITYNKASYCYLDSKGNKSEFTSKIFYIKKDTIYNIVHSNSMNGKSLSIITNIVQFSKDRVTMEEQDYINALGLKNSKQKYLPFAIVIRIPPMADTVSWISVDTLKCIASWTNVNINGVQKKAIKIAEILPDGDQKIEYYVKGVGLWNTEIKDTNDKITPFIEFKELNFDTQIMQSILEENKQLDENIKKNATYEISSGVVEDFEYAVNNNEYAKSFCLRAVRNAKSNLSIVQIIERIEDVPWSTETLNIVLQSFRNTTQTKDYLTMEFHGVGITWKEADVLVEYTLANFKVK